MAQAVAQALHGPLSRPVNPEVWAVAVSVWQSHATRNAIPAFRLYVALRVGSASKFVLSVDLIVNAQVFSTIAHCLEVRAVAIDSSTPSTY